MSSKKVWVCEVCGMEWDNEAITCAACGTDKDLESHTKKGETSQESPLKENEIEKQNPHPSKNEKTFGASKVNTNPIGKQLVELKLSGDRSMNEGNYTDAVKYYKQALEIDPKNAMLLNLMGDALMKNKSYQEAFQYFSYAFEQDPTMDAITDKIKMAKMRLENSQSLNMISKAPSLNNESQNKSERKILTENEKNQFDTLKLWGDRSMEMNDYQDAIEYYEKAFKIDNYNISLLEKMGDLMNKVNNFAQAKSFYSIATELNPLNDRLKKKLSSLVNIDSESKHTQILSQKHPYKSLSPADKQLFNSFKTSGDSFLKVNNLEKATENYEKAFNIDPFNPDLLEKMGDILVRIKAFKQALIFYFTALEVDPQNENITTKIGTIPRIAKDAERSSISNNNYQIQVQNKSSSESIPNSYKSASSSDNYSSSYNYSNNQRLRKKCAFCGKDITEHYYAKCQSGPNFGALICESCLNRFGNPNQSVRHFEGGMSMCEIKCIVMIITAIVCFLYFSIVRP